VQWVNTNAKTLCNIIVEKAKYKKVPLPSTNGTSDASSTSKVEENDVGGTETKERVEKVSGKD